MADGIQIVCSECGGSDVRRDAMAAWSPANQRWELVAIQDQEYCENDGAPCLGTEVSLDELPA